MDAPRAYALLGLPADAACSVEDLRAAHRAAIRRAHPDLGGTDARAIEVNEAFAYLCVLARQDEVAGSAFSCNAAGASASAGFGPSARCGVSASAASTGFRAGPDPAWSLVDVGALSGDPAELLLRIVEAAHEIGEVVAVDPQGGLAEVVVNGAPAGYGAGDLGAGQLLVQVGGDPHPGGGLYGRHHTQTSDGAEAKSARAAAQDAAQQAAGPTACGASRPADGGIPVTFTLEPLGAQPAPPIHEVVADLMRHVRRGS